MRPDMTLGADEKARRRGRRKNAPEKMKGLLQALISLSRTAEVQHNSSDIL